MPNEDPNSYRRRLRRAFGIDPSAAPAPASPSRQVPSGFGPSVPTGPSPSRRSTPTPAPRATPSAEQGGDVWISPQTRGEEPPMAARNRAASNPFGNPEEAPLVEADPRPMRVRPNAGAGGARAVGRGAGAGAGGSDQLNAAALRMAQGGEPTNDLERMVKARMDQLMQGGGGGSEFRPYKKGGPVKAYKKGGVVAKAKPAAPFPPAKGNPFAKSPGIASSRAAMPKQMLKKGGVVKKPAPEGSAKDMREDKKFAKKAGMSMAKWEKSAADKKHDVGKKPFRKGGAVKKGKC